MTDGDDMDKSKCNSEKKNASIERKGVQKVYNAQQNKVTKNGACSEILAIISPSLLSNKGLYSKHLYPQPHMISENSTGKLVFLLAPNKQNCVKTLVQDISILRLRELFSEPVTRQMRGLSVPTIVCRPSHNPFIQAGYQAVGWKSTSRKQGENGK